MTMTFFYAPQCKNYDCFQEAMKECNKVKYVNEQIEATWRYKVRGMDSGRCEVEVTLLQPKAGELGIERLIGNKMSCYFPRGVAPYPESDLERCHGRLKEELQSLVIKKLHSYIIENLGHLDEGLTAFS